MNLELPPPTVADTVPDLSQPLTDGEAVQCAAGEFHLKRVQLTCGASQGVELLLVESDRVRLALCPSRGMSLWKAQIDGVDYGWKSPVEGPIHPAFVAIDEPSGIGWLDGFDELLVRCGLRSFGAPDFDAQGKLLFPLHGRVGNLPARNVTVSVDAEHSLLTVEAEVHESRFLQYNLRLHAKWVLAFGEAAIRVHDTVVNAGATPTTMQLLYHINVGTPVLEAGARMLIDAPKAVARDQHAADGIGEWHTYRPPAADYAEEVYFYEANADPKGWAQSVLHSQDATCGFAVQFKTDTLPYFSQWKNTVGEADGYVTGFEPGTGFPNPRSFEEEQGRVVELGPGESREFQLRLEGLVGADRVAERVGAIRTDPKQVELVDFDPRWCMPR